MLHNRYKIKGGEDEVAFSESTMLRNSGHDVELLELNNDSIPVSGSLQTAVSAIWSRRAFRIVKENLSRQKVDVLHVQNFFPLWSPSVYYAACTRGVAVVQSVHNYRLICPAASLFRDGHHCETCVGKKIPWRGVAYGCYHASRPATGAIGALIATHWALGTWAKSVHQYIALTRYVREKLVAGGLPEDRISVKQNFIVDPSMGRQQSHCGEYYIYVGRLAKEKGLSVLFDAWKSLGEDQHLKLVGGGSMPEGLEVPKGAELLGERSIDETYDLIAGAKALILPALWAEPFGRVIIEAFALGTPVIASSAGGIPELVEHNLTGVLVAAGSSKSLAAAVDRVSLDAGLRSSLSSNARQKYLDSFTDKVNYEKLIAIYERAIDIARDTRRDSREYNA